MILEVNTRTNTVGIIDLDILSRFHVAIRGGDIDDLGGVDSAVSAFGAGRLDGHEVLVPVDWVLSQAVRAGIADESWRSEFASMVSYSASQGWIEGDGTLFRVHCEWPARPQTAVMDFTRTVFREGRVPLAFERSAATDLVDHTSAATTSGRDQVMESWIADGQASPARKYDIKHVVAEGEKVAIFANLINDPGSSPVAVVDLYRVSAGEIVEHWRIAQGSGSIDDANQVFG